MNSPSFDQIKKESLIIRGLIENCDKENTRLVTNSFPVMNCKLSSMLLCYHLLTLWPKTKIIGAGGIAKDRSKQETISHYWLEINGVAIDITGDQYNILEPHELNSAIVKKRPFNPVHVEHIEKSILYKLFRVAYRDTFIKGFPEVSEEFIHNLKISYKQIRPPNNYKT